MTTRLSAAFLTFIVLLVAIPASPAAVQGGVPPPAGAGPVDRNSCFADFIDHVKQCRDTFCPNRLTDCNQAALDACMSGARAVLDDCLADQG
jgi:hypothetical protein